MDILFDKQIIFTGILNSPEINNLTSIVLDNSVLDKIDKKV